MTDTKEEVFDRTRTARNLLNNFGITERLNREGVTEVAINRPNEIWIEDQDGWHKEEIDLSYKKAYQLANTLCTLNGKKIEHKNPTHSVQLPDGERGHIVIPPACEKDTVVICLRKPSKSRFTLDSYIETGRLSGFKDTGIEIDKYQFRDSSGKVQINYDTRIKDWQLAMLDAKANKDMETFFSLAVQNHCNICMVGGTGSGKTTFTKSVADLIDHNTRIITIEDTHELDLKYHENKIHLFYGDTISAKGIIAACMRLKPDRIFLTELRGNEAFDYLSALNTGHAGGLTSVHANDSISAFTRIAQLAKESETGQRLDHNFILNTVKATIDIVCFFKYTKMKELYFNPVVKMQAEDGRL